VQDSENAEPTIQSTQSARCPSHGLNGVLEAVAKLHDCRTIHGQRLWKLIASSCGVAQQHPLTWNAALKNSKSQMSPILKSMCFPDTSPHLVRQRQKAMPSGFVFRNQGLQNHTTVNMEQPACCHQVPQLYAESYAGCDHATAPWPPQSPRLAML